MISTISMAAACSAAIDLIPKTNSAKRHLCNQLKDAAFFLSQIEELTPEETLKQLRWCRKNRDLIKAAMALQDSARDHAGVVQMEELK